MQKTTNVCEICGEEVPEGQACIAYGKTHDNTEGWNYDSRYFHFCPQHAHQLIQGLTNQLLKYGHDWKPEAMGTYLKKFGIKNLHGIQ